MKKEARETDFKAVVAKKEKEAAAAKTQDETSKKTPQPESAAAAAQKKTTVDQKMTKSGGNEKTENVDSTGEEIKALIERTRAMDKKDKETLKDISKQDQARYQGHQKDVEKNTTNPGKKSEASRKWRPSNQGKRRSSYHT